MIIIGAVLLAGCSQDDVTVEVTAGASVPISFACSEETNITRAAYLGAMNSEDLYYSGFGVFASQTADHKPDLMYNQEVEFTFVGDMENPLKGYWSYQPVKYWPADMENSNFLISAYAPYVEPADLTGLTEDNTGIIGISTNTQSPYIEYRRCEKPADVVDLLWYVEEPRAIPTPSGKARGTMDMKLRHALARIEINVVLAEPAADTKVLIEKITLTGKMAKTGRLSLSSQTSETIGTETKYYPVWSDQVNDKDESDVDKDHTITISNADNDDASYGIIDSQVRYVDGLPYAWQPEGLTTTAQNALSTGDRTGYIYLIPQETLNLTVKVKYHKMTLAGGDEMKIKTTKDAAIINVGTTVDETKILRGNTTYTLNLTLSGI